MQPSSAPEFDTVSICTQFENKPAVHLSSEGHLVLPLSVADFDKVCNRFKKEKAIHSGILVWTPGPT